MIKKQIILLVLLGIVSFANGYFYGWDWEYKGYLFILIVGEIMIWLLHYHCKWLDSIMEKQIEKDKRNE